MAASDIGKTKKCEKCGKKFIVKAPTQIYCSPECRIYPHPGAGTHPQIPCPHRPGVRSHSMRPSSSYSSPITFRSSQFLHEIDVNVRFYTSVWCKIFSISDSVLLLP